MRSRSEMSRVSRKILVTGASGFIGSHFVNQMIDSANITILVRPRSDLGRLKRIISKLEVIEIDSQENWLITLENLQKNVQLQVVHFATAYQDSDDIIISNIEMPIKIINVLSLKNTHTFVNTDTFFGKSQVAGTPLPEYTRSKQEFLKQAQEICKLRAVKLVNMRLEHIYGINDSMKKFVPWLFRSLIENKKNIELTKCDQIRDFLNVLDAVRAYKTVLGRLEEIDNGTEISVGSGIGSTVESFVLMAKKLTNSTSNLCFGSIENRRDMMFSIGDPLTLHNFGWEPLVKLEDGLLELAEFMKNGA